MTNVIDIEKVRSETGVVGEGIYFNNARISPCPLPTLDVIRSVLDREYGSGANDSKGEHFLAAQSALAELINASADEIAITQSATYSVNLIANGLSWSAGDNIVISELAYRSVAECMFRVCNEQGVELRVAKTNDLLHDPQELMTVVDERTRLVVIPYVPVFCGVPQPIEEIGRLLADTPALFAVNATQAAGQLPIDVAKFKCDFLFGTSRKWLRGPRGLGFLYVRRALISELRPTHLGYPGVKWVDSGRYEIAETIDRFHAGDYPYASLAGLAESVRYAMRLGVENIAVRNRDLGQYCREALQSIPGVEIYDSENGKTGTVPINVAGFDADETVEHLAKNGIQACTIEKENAFLGLSKLGVERVVRISIHYFNTEDEIDHLAEVLNELAGGSGAN